MAMPIVTTDPRWKGPPTYTRFDRFWLSFLKDERDLVFVHTCRNIVIGLWPIALLLFIPGFFRWWMLPLYFIWVAKMFLARFILMLHAVLHRPIFKKEYDWMNKIIPWVFGPFFGQTPTSFFVHHIGMHHTENNQENDLSGTMAYQRDRFSHWLHYWARFFFVGTVHLARYLIRKRRTKLAKQLIFGEVAWFGAVSTLFLFNPGATFTVFIFPLLFIRVAFMMGNWAQHAFVDVNDPSNQYKTSSTLMNSPHNHLCFNDGYHVVHHLKPNLHWSEMAEEFERTQETYGIHDALVLEGVTNNQNVWVWLMTKNYERLAEHVRQIGPQQQRSREETIAWLKSRTHGQRGRIKGIFEFESTTPEPIGRNSAVQT